MNREISRQLIHAFAGTIIIASVALLGRELSLLLAALIFFIGLMLSMLVRVGVKADMLESLLKKVQRDYEKHFTGFGALMFFLGMVLLLFFFQRMEVIIGALVVSVYGDAASTLVGKAVGKHKIVGNYTLEGTLGGIIFSFALLSFLFPLHIALIVSVAGMLAELLPIDDNLSIPIVAGTVLSLLL